MGDSLCASIFQALIMRMALWELRELVEINVDDLAHSRWHASFGHDHQFVWGEPDCHCDFPVPTLMRQNILSGKVGELDRRRCRAFLIVAHRLVRCRPVYERVLPNCYHRDTPNRTLTAATV